MIITALFGLLSRFIDGLPQLELNGEFFDQFAAGSTLALEYLVSGISFLASLIGNDNVRLFGFYIMLVFSINVFYLAYQLLWFFIKKIPMLNIKP